jgi:DNA-binding LytR/AlgR family response regulator
MIRYIIVDDNPKVLEKVKAKIDTVAHEYELEHIASFNSSKKAFQEVNQADFDLLIVDFEMPVYNGIELAKKIANDKKIIFLTSTTDNEKLVINNLDISGYLSKPFEIEEFQQILKNKIFGKINIETKFKKGDRLTIAIGPTQDIGFYPDETFYIRTNISKNYVDFYGEQDKIKVTKVRITIKELSEKLKPYGFEKINQSTIVNLSKINKRYNKILTLVNCEEEFMIGDNEKLGLITRIRFLLGI